jgi:hypothetical protein
MLGRFLPTALCLTSPLAACSIGPGSSLSTPDSGDVADSGPLQDSGVPTVSIAVPLTRCPSPVISSFGLNGPLYTAKVSVGGSQTFQMLVDTGSSEMGVASSSCTDCMGVSPLYNPGPNAVDLHQTSGVVYNGSAVSGELFTDDVQVGQAQTVPVNFLAIVKQINFLTQSPLCTSYQGVLGLGTPGPAERDYFAQVVALRRSANMFAVGLCETGGSLWLGGYDPSTVTGIPQFTQMDQSGFYTIQLTGFEVAGNRLNVPSTSYGAAVVDTGDPLLRLPGDALQAAAMAIASNADFQKLFGGAAWFSSPTPSCATVGMTAAELDAALPPLTLTFGSNPSISVQARATSSYLQAQISGSNTSWCPGLAAYDVASTGGGSGGSGGTDAGGLIGAGPVAIVGDAFLRSSVVIFDRQNQRMGFAPHTCP